MLSGSHSRFRIFVPLCVGALFCGAALIQFDKVGAQSAAPVLISQEDSTRALSFESVTQEREPFSTVSPVKFGTDNQTRIMLFAMNLTLQAGDTVASVSVEAEDFAHRVYQLPIEYIGAVADQPWATSVVVRLSDDMNDVGDVLVRLSYRGLASNRVRVALGHVGGGLPDDQGAVATPGSPIPFGPSATAGNLSIGDVQTIISQAVSAAVSVNRAVTVSVTDREANVLGVFVMTGAPANTTIRSVGTIGRGLEGTVVPASMAAISKAGTGSLFSTSGNAFSTRTAGFIIQEHFPPGVQFRSGGPLYGIRLPYSNVTNPPAPATLSFGSLPGVVPVAFPIRSAQTSAFVPANVGGVAGEVDLRFFPFTGGGVPAGPDALTASDVQTIIAHAAQQANITRAAIRQPLGSNARVTIAVVDAAGTVLGVFRQLDAPVFGFDVAVQKARTASFYSSAPAATLLRGAGFSSYADRALADGLKLDGSIAFTDRAGGFLHRPFFPDGINNTAAGPFSTVLSEWSPFNVGLQLDLIKTSLLAAIGGVSVPCSTIPN